MSDVSYSNPYFFHDDLYLDRLQTPQEFESTEIESRNSHALLFTFIYLIGSEYPTSNLFLSELYGIKEALDDASLDENEFIRDIALKMKKKFDKYWGTCNLLIYISVVLDPR